jgi:hypothetical protein
VLHINEALFSARTSSIPLASRSLKIPPPVRVRRRPADRGNLSAAPRRTAKREISVGRPRTWSHQNYQTSRPRPDSPDPFTRILCPSRLTLSINRRTILTCCRFSSLQPSTRPGNDSSRSFGRIRRPTRQANCFAMYLRCGVNKRESKSLLPIRIGVRIDNHRATFTERSVGKCIRGRANLHSRQSWPFPPDTNRLKNAGG